MPTICFIVFFFLKLTNNSSILCLASLLVCSHVWQDGDTYLEHDNKGQASHEDMPVSWSVFILVGMSWWMTPVLVPIPSIQKTILNSILIWYHFDFWKQIGSNTDRVHSEYTCILLMSRFALCFRVNAA